MKINAKKSAYSTLFANYTFKSKINLKLALFIKDSQQYKYLKVQISLNLD
jgi:hypothetical protein